MKKVGVDPLRFFSSHRWTETTSPNVLITPWETRETKTRTTCAKLNHERGVCLWSMATFPPPMPRASPVWIDCSAKELQDKSVTKIFEEGKAFIDIGWVQMLIRIASTRAQTASNGMLIRQPKMGTGLSWWLKKVWRAWSWRALQDTNCEVAGQVEKNNVPS